MINFIICEDKKDIREKYKIEISNYMMQYDINYQLNIFDDYNEKWKKFAREENEFKVFILDLKTPHGSGLDAARMIREEYDDWTSMIIIVTAFSQYRYEALSKRLMILDYICKLEDCREQLRRALTICLKNYNNRPKFLKYVYQTTTYSISLKQILTIEREADSKKCTIKTLNNVFYMSGSLNNILKKLDDRFIKCNRSTIINMDQIQEYRPQMNKIILSNGSEINTISRSKRKPIYDYVRGIN